MEGIWVPTNYYLQIKPQIHQILEASEAMMDMQFDRVNPQGLLS